MSVLTGLRASLETLPRMALLAIASSVVLAVGLADYVTGYDISLGILYTVPIGMLAWFVSKKAGLVAAFASASIWYLVNSAFAPPDLARSVTVWNSLVRLAYFTVISTLLSHLKDAYDYQRVLAQTDSLTGLLNSRAFKALSHIELARASRLGYPVAVIYMDLDDFKDLNDLRGHAAGDELLRNLGRVLKGTLRETDLVGRLGGDEFAVLLPGAGMVQADATVTRLQAAILEANTDAALRVSATMGALVSAGSKDIDALIRKADHLMYRGKATHKGSCIVEPPD